MANTPKKRFPGGAALLVTAAFIGPGTVLAASKAGVMHGMSLLWVVAFSVVAAIVLQEMAGRLGIVTKGGLVEAIKGGIPSLPLRWIALVLVLLAILVGNGAYQTGNLRGAAAGFEILAGIRPDSENVDSYRAYVVVVIAALVLAMIWIGRLPVIQYCMMALVGLMSILFVAAAVGSQPTATGIASGLLPKIPGNDWMLVIGLIGTTVVPYNLFLHASAIAEKESVAASMQPGTHSEMQAQIRRSWLDTCFSIGIGGLITAAILITGAMVISETPPKSVTEFAALLEPSLGRWAELVFAFGLLAAGVTSSVTAPVAAGYVAAGCFGWRANLAEPKVKWVATLIVACGCYFSITSGSSPIQTIILAQATNGLLLPIVAAFLLVCVNRKALMGSHTNTLTSNVLGVFVVGLTAILAYRMFFYAWKTWESMGG